jgi:hypothetical protein
MKKITVEELYKSTQKVYTEEQVSELVGKVSNESILGLWEWFMEVAVIVDKETKQPLENAELYLIPENTGRIDEFIFPRLEKIGVKLNKKL